MTTRTDTALETRERLMTSSTTRGDPDRVNVVRLVEFLGPMSPELVLVDPELAARARALLPEEAGVRIPRRDRDEPIPLGLARPPLERRVPWRLVTALAVASVAIAAFGLGWSTASGTSEDEAALQSSPPVAAPTPASTVPQRPVGPGTKAKPSRSKPPLVAPRFVWPAQSGADGYRVAFFLSGRKVFERHVTQPALQLPSSWRFKGRSERLTRGTYRWVVWPTFGTSKRLGPAIVSAQYAA
jgi:hypothetical protein